MDWMVNMASLNRQKAYYMCQLLLELGIYSHIRATSQFELFQVRNHLTSGI